MHVPQPAKPLGGQFGLTRSRRPAPFGMCR